MRKLISFMHISLDGFVAGENGEMNWIKIDQELFDYVGQRISKGNTAMYGKNTFQMMENYWPMAGKKENASKHDKEHSAWYNGIRKLVISSTLNESDYQNTLIINTNLVETIKKIQLEDGPEILVFGSPGATHSLLKNNLIDGFWLFVNPIILGKGIPLFKDVPSALNLQLLKTQTFNSGVVELDYLVIK